MSHGFKRVRCSFIAAAATILMAGAPSAEETPVDVKTNDPFLWLEEVEGERALKWVRAQNERSLAELEGHAVYEAMYREALAILTSDDRVPGVTLRNGFAYNFWRDETHVRGIYRRMPTDDYLAGKEEWDVVMDLDAIAAAEKANWVFGGLTCLAPDYRRCMVELSPGGSDAAVFREYDLEDRAFVDAGFEVGEAKTSVAWLDADTLLIGTDFGEGTLTESGYARQVRRWTRGQNLLDAEVLFEAAVTDTWAFPFSYWDGKRYHGGVFHGETFYDSNWLLITDDTPELTRLPLPKKARVHGLTSGRLIATVQEPLRYAAGVYAAGSVVALEPPTGAVALLYQPTDVSAVEDVRLADEAVYINVLDNIRSRIVRFSHGARGWRGHDVALPEDGILSIGTVDHDTGEMIAVFEDPLTPQTHFYVKKRKAKEIRQSPQFFDSSKMLAKRYEAVSRDGTRVPYTVIGLEASFENGPAPTIQYGYGGFEISILPTYSGTTGKLWLERGGLYVLTNIRGGGEFGPSWHQAGLKGNRQRIYDDFFAVSEDLIRRNLTAPEKLGILGGSNGGLLMGVSMVQRPDLYRAVGIGVPLLDMLRYHELLAGASWVGEYGDPDNPSERPFLETISPYHNIEPNKDYPRPFFFTSTKDDRVHPGHARKTARLMEQYDYPFLYYENIEGGHGAAANLQQSAKRLALQNTYFAVELGLLDPVEGD